MKEIEIKILEIDHTKLEQKLISLGAEKIFEGELYAVFFDMNDSRIRKSNETLRLRKEGTRVFITHKKKIHSDSVKIRDETEIEVSDFDDAKKLITSLGFDEFDTIRKRRVSYKLDDVRFEFDKLLDRYEHIPEFLEIETKDIDEVHRYAKLLGFSKEKCKPWSGKDVIKHYL